MDSLAMSGKELFGWIQFMYGNFCAYWAQETDRNPWLWFFGGAVFGPFVGLILLYKNSKKEVIVDGNG